jgi:predicted Zn-dependent protease
MSLQQMSPHATMTQNAAPSVAFKFKLVRNGHEVGYRSKQGALGLDSLQLDGQIIPFAEVADTAARDNRLVLVLRSESPARLALQKQLTPSGALPLAISGGHALDIKRAIDRNNSAQAADDHYRKLLGQARGAEFRAAPCTHCQATLDLTEAGQPRYIYCPYCETLLAGTGQPIADGDHYAVCDECRLFGRIQGYTEFYFYFLLVVYGFSWKRRHVCDSCADKMFRKTLLVNLVFLLGVPSAVWIKIKSLVDRDPSYGELAQANTLAAKGQVAEAQLLYEAIARTYPDHPGILRNIGLAYFNAKNTAGAQDYLTRALHACPTYAPAQQSLSRLQAMLTQAGQQAR